MTMHAVTCRLTAKYGISSIPQHSTYEPLPLIVDPDYRPLAYFVQSMHIWLFSQVFGTPSESDILYYIEYLITSDLIRR